MQASIQQHELPDLPAGRLAHPLGRAARPARGAPAPAPHAATSLHHIQKQRSIQGATFHYLINTQHMGPAPASMLGRTPASGRRPPTPDPFAGDPLLPHRPPMPEAPSSQPPLSQATKYAQRQLPTVCAAHTSCCSHPPGSNVSSLSSRSMAGALAVGKYCCKSAGKQGRQSRTGQDRAGMASAQHGLHIHHACIVCAHSAPARLPADRPSPQAQPLQTLQTPASPLTSFGEEGHGSEVAARFVTGHRRDFGR